MQIWDGLTKLLIVDPGWICNDCLTPLFPPPPPEDQQNVDLGWIDKIVVCRSGVDLHRSRFLARCPTLYSLIY